jgi:hypothetical protein
VPTVLHAREQAVAFEALLQLKELLLRACGEGERKGGGERGAAVADWAENGRRLGSGRHARAAAVLSTPSDRNRCCF